MSALQISDETEYSIETAASCRIILSLALHHFQFDGKTSVGVAGALVYWLWEETRVLKVVGSNPSTIFLMDIFTHISCKNCNVCLKAQNKLKRGRGWPNFVQRLDYKRNNN